jgi:hypothetical protein
MRPYLNGVNVLQCTNAANESPDIIVGEIDKVACTGTDEISSLTIKMKWLVRIPERIHGLDWKAPGSYEPIPGSRRTNYNLIFEHPQLIQKRSPLTLRSGSETIEISHVTELASVVLELKKLQ